MLRWLRRFKRHPNFVIGNPPYLLRWWLLPRNRWFNIYLHCVLRDDDDRVLHDHPWTSLSIVLRGSYREVTPRGTRLYEAGSVIFRTATLPHRLEVVDGPVWTLFITGRRIRDWGFHCPKGWVPWQQFVAPHDSGQIGRGCDQD